MSTILIADDDELMSYLVRFKLETAGHDVMVAENGEEVLSMAQERLPDLFMLDTMMPLLTGPEVLERLKADPRTRDVPVIMLTARRGEDAIVDALRGGAADYLTKPFSPEAMLERVETVLAKSHDTGASRLRA